MGQFRIIIDGYGAHGNRQSADVERRAQQFVNGLVSEGVIVDQATCVVGTDSHDLLTMDRRVDDPEGAARRAYERYRQIRINQTRRFASKVPPLWDELDFVDKSAWMAAVEAV